MFLNLLFCNFNFLIQKVEKFVSKHTVNSIVYRILSLITTISGIDEFNNTAELLYPQRQQSCAGKIEQNDLENQVVTPLESTIIECRNAVAEKMDLSLRLATQVTVGQVRKSLMSLFRSEFCCQELIW